MVINTEGEERERRGGRRWIGREREGRERRGGRGWIGRDGERSKDNQGAREVKEAIIQLKWIYHFRWRRQVSCPSDVVPLMSWQQICLL